MKLLILWARLPSYLAGFCRHLQDDHDFTVVVAGLGNDQIESSGAPVSRALYSDLDARLLTQSQIQSSDYIEQLIRSESPDLMVVSGWQYRPYKRLYTNASFRHIPIVLASDNTWSGSLRQRLGRLIVRPMLNRASLIWVPGKRGRDLMRRWHVPDEKIVDGLYNVDGGLIGARSDVDGLAEKGRKTFLYIGQLVERKGFHHLIEAYQRYRDRVDTPWDLLVCGRGPLQSLCTREGVNWQGFVDGSKLPELLHTADAFVLPSRYDAWGVVIAEAACAGLPIISTTGCGATDDLVVDGVNGLRIPPESSSAIENALKRVHDLPVAELRSMGESSKPLANPFRSECVAARMAEAFRSIVAEHQPRN